MYTFILVITGYNIHSRYQGSKLSRGNTGHSETYVGGLGSFGAGENWFILFIHFNHSHRYTYIIVSMTLFIDLLHDYLNMSLGFIHGKWGSHGWTRGPFTLIVAVASGLQ